MFFVISNVAHSAVQKTLDFCFLFFVISNVEQHVAQHLGQQRTLLQKLPLKSGRMAPKFRLDVLGSVEIDGSKVPLNFEAPRASSAASYRSGKGHCRKSLRPLTKPSSTCC